jgi:hypothetical protein
VAGDGGHPADPVRRAAHGERGGVTACGDRLGKDLKTEKGLEDRRSKPFSHILDGAVQWWATMLLTKTKPAKTRHNYSSVLIANNCRLFPNKRYTIFSSSLPQR